MAHDEHFLSRLSRVGDAEVEVALALYQDPALVKAVLERAGLPEGADRCALALGPKEAGPYVVLHRSGHFVTCLAEGMGVGHLPVIGLSTLEAVATRVERLRERMEVARSVAPDDSLAQKLERRLHTAGPAITREEFIAHLAWLPVTAQRRLNAYLGWLGAIGKTLAALNGPAGPAALRERMEKELASTAWATGHVAALFLAEEDTVARILALPNGPRMLIDTFGAPLIHFEVSGCSLRAAHGLARVGKPLLPEYKAVAPTNDVWLVVTGMMFAHPKLETEVRRVIARRDPDGELANLPYAQAAEAIRVVGRHEATQLFFDEDRPLFAHAGEVPEELAIPALASRSVAHDETHISHFLFLPLLAAARLSAQDLYVPAEYARYLRTPPLQTVGHDMVTRWHDLYVRREPARRPDQAGRNDPCPCGSGRKYKKCCAT